MGILFPAAGVVVKEASPRLSTTAVWAGKLRALMIAGADVGAAISNLSTQAIALDLFVHQMAGFNAETARWRSLSER
jgi:hypothetical protein